MLTGVVSNKDAVITVLAPTNSAFGAIDRDTLSALLANKEDLTDVRNSHLTNTSPCYLILLTCATVHPHVH